MTPNGRMEWLETDPKVPLQTIIEEAVAYFRTKHGEPSLVEICDRCPVPVGMELPIRTIHYIHNPQVVGVSGVYRAVEERGEVVPVIVPDVVPVIRKLVRREVYNDPF